MKRILGAAALAALAGCASAPTGPGVMVLPGSGKTFDHFRYDDHECRQYAGAQIGTTPEAAAADAGARSAAAGAVIGGLAGAAIGGSGSAAVGGAALGGAGGALVGTGTAQQSARGAQHRYDMAYQQCMYAKGHKIPMARGYARTPYERRPTVPPPPPPPGTPPPPPPR